MNSFIKENLSLVAALALPLLFAGFFFVSKQVGAPPAPAPTHDFVLMSDAQYGAFEPRVVDGVFKLKFTYPRRDTSGYLPTYSAPEIYYVDIKTMAAERVSVNLPDDVANPSRNKEGSSIEIPVQRLENIKLTNSAVSPDGYELSSDYSYEGNLMTEIFSSGRSYHNGMVVRNGSTTKEIKGLTQNYGLKIIGWVAPSTKVVPGE